ncbi:transcriptional regulator family: Fungal Specific TF [Aspergillus niger]|nr:transcriptional regulator family: Fungal Specific TF [Aspergillus niger]KAI2892446.1 transcriptional regulator family: Fungal Specific TF [Aspergillus niger]KAI2977359.1 transcriptional regulator family: Fungal Specific TF [Aspergillus niger]KAI2980411.1 transcriptional regulator family: Fungal Specific TF [Aspergillus niger]KAI3020876.1 transcriptional regulator family: Fungal Specific TF [Aspergillus niger]
MLEAVLRMHGITPTPTTGTGGSSDAEGLCEALRGTLTLDQTMNFDQDGELRYFGPSSGRQPIQQYAGGGDLSSSEPSGQSDGSGQLRSRRGVNRLYQSMTEDDQIDPTLVSELVSLYFTWECPWAPVVDEALFRRSWQAKDDDRYFSPLLLNAILACGSRHNDRVEIRSDPDDPNTAGRLFLEKAEVLLYYDLKCPNITTLQSLVIMATTYIAMGAEAAGWLHQGMASRLAQDMGLNLDSVLLRSSANLSMEDVDLRRRVYWALYCDDKLAASYTGRVCTLMLAFQMRLQFPGSRNGCHKRSTVAILAEGDMITAHLVAFSLLCQILETMLQSLWAPQPLLDEAQRSEFFNKCLLQLRSWFYDLPPRLRIDRPNQFPHVYVLHMTYHTGCILLARPFLRSWPTSAENTQEAAQKLCRNAARAILATAQKYQQQFSSFRRSPISATHAIVSAAVVFLGEYSVTGTGRSEIESCLQVLGELSTSWNCANRFCQNLRAALDRLSSTRTDLSPHLSRETIIPKLPDVSALDSIDIFPDPFPDPFPDAFPNPVTQSALSLSSFFEYNLDQEHGLESEMPDCLY